MRNRIYIYSRIPSEIYSREPRVDEGTRKEEAFGAAVERPVARKDLRSIPCFRRTMKRDLMEILCCPVCKGDLELTVDVEKDEILEGSLFCKNCNHRYVIRDGIPDLLPPDFK